MLKCILFVLQPSGVVDSTSNVEFMTKYSLTGSVHLIIIHLKLN